MSQKSPTTIALFGLFGVNNLGNEATLAAAVHALRTRLPDVRLVLLSAAPDQVAQLECFPIQIDHDALPVMEYLWRVRSPQRREKYREILQWLTEPFRAFRTRKQARGLDLLLIAGTGIADDFGQGPFDVPHHLYRWCRVVRGEGAAVRFASIGAGPVSHSRSRRWFRGALQCADYRSYRESSSKQFALDLGVQAESDRVLPDLVFSLPIPPHLSGQSVQWPPRTIGLGVMGYYGWNAQREAGEKIYADYLDKISWLAGQLLDRGYSVRLLVGNRGGDQRAVTDVVNVTNARRTGRDGSVTARQILSYLDVLEEIAQTDLVVATRFHNVLLAFLLERPVISIEYAQKNNDLMAEMGFADYCHSIETFDSAAVLAQVERLALLPHPPLDLVRTRIAKYRELLQQQYDELIRSL